MCWVRTGCLSHIGPSFPPLDHFPWEAMPVCDALALEGEHAAHPSGSFCGISNSQKGSPVPVLRG